MHERLVPMTILPSPDQQNHQLHQEVSGDQAVEKMRLPQGKRH